MSDETAKQFAAAWPVAGRLLDDAHPSWHGTGARVRAAELLAATGDAPEARAMLARIFAVPREEDRR